MKSRFRFFRLTSGQSLVETALMMPLILMLTLNAVNFGYFFFVTVNLAASPRSAALYSIQGSSSPTSSALPPAPSSTDKQTSASTNTLSVAHLLYQDMIGALASPQTKASAQICTAALGQNPKTNKWQCVTCSTYSGNCSAPFDSPGGTDYTDPEASFVMNRIDVHYQFSPLINGTPFNIVLLASPVCTSTGGSVNCTFHTKSSMRALN
jgi:Flp pilus assembly protein TadG